VEFSISHTSSFFFLREVEYLLLSRQSSTPSRMKSSSCFFFSFYSMRIFNIPDVCLIYAYLYTARNVGDVLRGGIWIIIFVSFFVLFLWPSAAHASPQFVPLIGCRVCAVFLVRYYTVHNILLSVSYTHTYTVYVCVQSSTVVISSAGEKKNEKKVHFVCTCVGGMKCIMDLTFQPKNKATHTIVSWCTDVLTYI
jgi:hypothetical protein